MIRAIHMAFNKSLAIISDSYYSIRAANMYRKWSLSDLANLKDLKNPDKIMELVGLIKQRKSCKIETDFKWIKAHDGHEGNEAADDLANKGALYSVLPGHKDYISDPLSEEAWKEIQEQAQKDIQEQAQTEAYEQ